VSDKPRCENPKCRRVLPPPGVFAGKTVEARFCGAECRSTMSHTRQVETFARRRAKTETCPTCHGRLGHDGPVLYCLDRERCDWSAVVKLSDVRKENAARRTPDPEPDPDPPPAPVAAPTPAPPPPRPAKVRAPQQPKPGTTTGRALVLLVTQPDGLEAHAVERALGLTFPVTLMALRRLVALRLVTRDPETRRYTAARGVVAPALRHLQTPELRGLVAALATLPPVMVKRVMVAAAEVRAAAAKRAA
jgi:hypothetical protein